MKSFVFHVVLVHSLASMVGAVGCLMASQVGLSLVFLVMSFLFFIIARGIEVLR